MPGVVESAVVGSARRIDQERVHAVLVLDRRASMPEAVVRAANTHARTIISAIRSFSIWTDGRAAAHRRHEEAEARGDQGVGRDRRAAGCSRVGDDPLQALLARFAGGTSARRRARRSRRSGLSSLERVELMVALEDQVPDAHRRNASSPARRRSTTCGRC